MILPETGEVNFASGLRITAHTPIVQLLADLPSSKVSTNSLPIDGWNQHLLGIHESDFGRFEVEVVSGSEDRVEGAFLSHIHPFYRSDTPEDSERRAFHDGVIATDLRGQKEFSWGNVFCRVDPKQNRDWLVVIYTPFSSVPLHQREIYRMLVAHEPPPETGHQH